MLPKIMFFIKKPVVILSIFILFKLIQTGYGFYYGEVYPFIPYLRLGEILIYVVISYFAIKNNKIALWVMGIFLLPNIFSFCLGLFVVPFDQYIIKSVFVILGAYFFVGGIILIQIARGKIKAPA